MTSVGALRLRLRRWLTLTLARPSLIQGEISTPRHNQMDINFALQVLKFVREQTADADLNRNPNLQRCIQALDDAVNGANFSRSVVEVCVERLISQCPKYLRRGLYSLLVSQADQEFVLRKRKAAIRTAAYEYSNIRRPWRGG